MKPYLLSLLFLIANFFGSNCIAQFAPLQTKERFAGLHFDFHAGMTDSAIGHSFTAEMIDSLLLLVKPDFIQVDCKGHPGVSSYPTKVGYPAPAIEKDILQIWRDVTRKHGVDLYVHYSGVWDNQAILHHPNWARINADGKPDGNANSVFGGYVDSLLIPQLKELATVYGLNGVWVDGDCWTLSPDYGVKAISAFSKETGIVKVPQKTDDPHFFEWMEFNRKAFRNYVSRYANAVHAIAPGFKVTSNWSFSSLMPEKVDVPVDYLSGDVAGINGLYSSCYESRCLALQGKPWDLMSWSFAWKNNTKATKSVAQLKQEAAEVLATGGGFQTYWQQNRDGTPEPYQFAKMAELVKFCKDRKPFTFNSQIVPQVGLLFSNYAWKRIPSTGLYNAHGQEGIKGILNLLMDGRYPVEILMDHQLSSRLNQYQLIVIPEWEHIDPQQRETLLAYVKNGGRLLVVGSKATSDFKSELGVEMPRPVMQAGSLFAGFNSRILTVNAAFQPVVPREGVIKIGSRLKADDWRFATEDCLATITALGKGSIAGIYLDMGQFYNNNQNPFSLEIIQSVIQQMSPTFISTLSAPNLHQVVSRKNNKLYIHLINTNGPHHNPNVLVYDRVEPIKDVVVSVALTKTPRSVKLQPNGPSLAVTYEKGRAHIKIPLVDVYSIVEIQE